MKDERREQFERECRGLIDNMTDALFVAWGRGVLAGRAEEMKNNTIDAGDAYQRGYADGRQEEREAHTLELRSREESYQKGYADGMKEAVRMAERMVEE